LIMIDGSLFLLPNDYVANSHLPSLCTEATEGYETSRHYSYLLRKWFPQEVFI
jgi:hypothetical protein